jgi:hypothetical protein
MTKEKLEEIKQIESEIHWSEQNIRSCKQIVGTRLLSENRISFQIGNFYFYVSESLASDLRNLLYRIERESNNDLFLLKEKFDRLCNIFASYTVDPSVTRTGQFYLNA